MPRSRPILLPLLCWVLLAACHDSSSTAVHPNTTPPTANAGTTQHVTIPVAAVTLDGSASSSADGGAITYDWTFVSVPAGSAATLAGSNTSSPTFTPDVPGRYVVQLVVSEGSLASSAATVTVGASGNVDLLVNGSFESGLIGWTQDANLQPNSAGIYSFNGVVAPGTEIYTGTAGWAATDGTQTALGYVQDIANNGAIITAALYQDVTIPADATAITISFDIGLKNITRGGSNTGVKVGLFSTSRVPYFNDIPMSTSSLISYSKTSDDATLVHKTVTVDATPLAGYQYRFAILNAANGTGGVGSSGSEVIGIDDVHLHALLSY